MRWGLDYHEFQDGERPPERMTIHHSVPRTSQLYCPIHGLPIGRQICPVCLEIGYKKKNTPVCYDGSY